MVYPLSLFMKKNKNFDTNEKGVVGGTLTDHFTPLTPPTVVSGDCPLDHLASLLIIIYIYMLISTSGIAVLNSASILWHCSLMMPRR